MKIRLFLILVVKFIALTFMPNSVAQDSPQWHLPVGVTARLGKGAPRDVQYSPDGTRLAVSTEIGVWIYDADTGEELDLLIGEESDIWDGVNGIAYSPDGRILVGANGFELELWDVVSGQLKDSLTGHRCGVMSVAFSPDGRILASSDLRSRVMLWDAVNGQHKTTLTGHTDVAWNIAFSPDGRTLASASGDKTVRLWDVAGGEHKATLVGHTDRVESVAFSPDGKTLASGAFDDTIRLWDAHTGQHRATLIEDNDYPWDAYHSVAFSPDGQTLASGSWDGVQLWDVTGRQHKVTLRGHKNTIRSLTFSPDGLTLASGGFDGTVRLWDVNTRQQKTLLWHMADVNGISFSPDGQTFATAASDTVRLWDAHTGAHQAIFSWDYSLIKGAAVINSVTFSPDGRTLAGGAYGQIQLWDVGTGKYRQSITGHKGRVDSFLFKRVDSLAFSPDGRILASCGWEDQTIRLWNVATSQLKAILTGHTNAVLSVAFSPDGRTLASASQDNTVRLWDVATSQPKSTLTRHTSGVASVSFSPDGRTLASGSWDETIQLWDAHTGKHKASLTDANYGGSDIIFTPDSRTLIFADIFGKILLWDITRGRLLETIKGHKDRVSGMALSADGRTLVSGSNDGGVVYLWDFNPFISQQTQPDTDTQQTEDDTVVQQYEREMVRLVYFRPSDRSHRQGIEKELDTLIRWTQYFYAEQMQGIGNRKTFAFETDPTGYAKVHHVTGKFTDTYYHQDTYDKVLKEVAEQFDTSKNVYLIAADVSSEYINNEGICGIGGGGWNSSNNEAWRRDFGGTAVIPASGVCINPSITAHELGHVFGLEHDFRDNAYLMGYGTQQRLSHCATEWLDAHRFFNNDPTFFNENATIAMRASNASNPRDLRLQFELNDADGLRQAQLLVPVAATDPASGLKLHSCKSLNGKRQTVEFVTTDLTVGVDSEITLQVIDVSGNITKQTFPLTIEDNISNRSPLAIGAIPAQTLTVSGSSITLNVSSYFNDPDNDVLSYTAESNDTSVVVVSLSGTRVTIAPKGTGSATVTVTASDGKLQIVQHLTVQVKDVRVTDTVETDSVIGTIRADDLVLYLPFDAGVGTTATDASKHSNNGIVHNARWVQGKDGEAIKLTGQRGSWVEVPDSPSLDITDEITLMAWVHPTQFTNEWLRIIVKTWAGDTAPWMVYGLYEQGGSNGKTGFIMSVDGGREVRCGNGPSPQLPLNQWTHLAATYDGSWMKLYYNGELKVETAATGRIDTNDVPLSIGRNSEGNREHYVGLIDEVAIWNVALDISEIRRAMGADASDTPIATTPLSNNFDDPFEGTTLQNPNWQWQNEPANWDVGETRRNFLHIESETNRSLWISDTSHFLYQETDADTFDVETHFFARWDTASGVNGLVVKSPADNNWVTLKFWSRGPGAKGQIQYQTKGKENGNGLTGNAGFTPTHGNTELFFRLRKQGDTYTGWYKTRAAEPWIEIGVTHFPLTPPLQLGIYAGVAAQTGTLTVDYEYFRSTTDPAVLAAPAIHLSTVEVPEDTTLLPNYPNPFNPETWIPYQLAKPADVMVRIYGIDGRLVRRLSLGHQAAGMYHGRSRAVYWDGRNEFGEPVASGIYFYTLTAGNYTATRKMLIRK